MMHLIKIFIKKMSSSFSSPTKNHHQQQKPQQQSTQSVSSSAYDTKKVGNYEIGRLIGDGKNISLSKVRLAMDRNTKEPFAIKIIDKQYGLHHHRSGGHENPSPNDSNNANKNNNTTTSFSPLRMGNSSPDNTKEQEADENQSSISQAKTNNQNSSTNGTNSTKKKVCPIDTMPCKKDIAAAKQIRHKNIVNLKEVLQTSKNVYFVTELVTGGELFDRLVLSPEQVSKVRNFMRKRGIPSSNDNALTKLLQKMSSPSSSPTGSPSSGGASPSSLRSGGFAADSSDEDEEVVKLLKDVIIPEEALQYYEEAGNNNSNITNRNRDVNQNSSNGTDTDDSLLPMSSSTSIIENFLGPNSANINSNRGPSAYPRFREDAARKYFQQLISAIRFCHQNGIHHKNLKPENLLLDREGRLKISDMNLTRVSIRYFWGVKYGAASVLLLKNSNNNNNKKNGSDDDDDDENNERKKSIITSLSEVEPEGPSSPNSLTATSLAKVLEDRAKQQQLQEEDLNNKRKSMIKSVASTVGNIHFAAPEIILQKGYSSNISDIWSCGAILYLMLAGHNAFDDPDPAILMKKIEKGQYFMSPNIPDSAKDLIKKILVVEPARRMSINDIIAHPWFQTNLDPSELDHGFMLTTNTTSTNNIISSRLQNARRKSIGNRGEQQQTEGDGSSIIVDQSAAGGDATEGANDAEKEKAKNIEYIKKGEDAFMIARKLMLASLVSSPRVEAVAARAAREAALETGQASSGGGASFSPTAALRYVLLRVHFENVSRTMSDILSQIMPHFQRPAEGSLEFRGYVQAKHSLLTFLIVVSRTVVPHLTLCEIRKGRGDFFDFIEFVSAIINALGSGRVASQEMIIRTPAK